ncbi:MAG: hypothetical protein KF745_07035 [Phycisphaeraceae bacterium]|nr:hypothetical protein [Phycisphaeraceae bacterium]
MIMHRRVRGGLIAAVVLTVFPALAHATFHLMQIEMVIGGVNGDTTAQAIQLRMRSAFPQDQLQNSRLVAYDAAGLNPVVLIAFPPNSPDQLVGSGLGSRVLVVSPGFGNHSTPAMQADFVMTSPIPASYLAAGRVTFEDNFGSILWSVSFGGAAYTGSTTGEFTNDSNGNFGPSFAGPLPTAGLQALRFSGTASAGSTTNAADYALTAGAAVFNNFAGTAFTISVPPCPADRDGNGVIEPTDIAIFVLDWFNSISGGTLAGDFDGNGTVEPADIASFIGAWVAALSGGCG